MKSDTTQQKKARHPKKPAAVEGGQMPNYSEDEDYLIAVAFINVTVDPIRGVGQKGENFWTQVHDKFCMLQQKELVESGQHIQVRNKDSIEQRWKKGIAKSVQLWNKHYKQLKGINKSGWNEDKYVEEASNLYKGETGEPFRFQKCVTAVLHKLPKFDPMVVVGLSSLPRIMHVDDSSADDDEDNGDIAIVRKKATVNNDVPPQGSNMQRPMGMKKAKLMKKFEDASVAVAALPFDSLSNNGSNILADMSNATEDLVVAFKANASLKRDELRMIENENGEEIDAAAREERRQQIGLANAGNANVIQNVLEGQSHWHEVNDRQEHARLHCAVALKG
jgi:hypothetical protein